jgi:predicted dehydrogenase
LSEKPVQVWATRGSTSDESVTTVVRFDGGSVGTLVYACTGASATPKERIEILAGGLTAIVDNFQTVELHREGKRLRRRRAAGKGYAEQLRDFAAALRGEAPLMVTVEDGIRATACALVAQESLATGIPHSVDIEGKS